MWSKWFLLAAAIGLPGLSVRPEAARGDGNKKADYTKVEIQGTLEGEGGYLGVRVNPGVRDGSYVWELNFSKNPKLRKTADNLKGRIVIVTGEIRLVGGTLDNDGNFVGNRPFAPHQRQAVFVKDLKVAQKSAQSKTDPPGVPLEARLIAKKDTYVLDLGGKTPQEFRKLLKGLKVPAPAVDLELEFRNSGDKDLTFLVGGFAPDIPLLLKLEGPGAVNVALRALFVRIASKPPQKVTLAPGKTRTLPIKSLMTARLNREGSASYWTEPGAYTLIATYKTAVSPVPKGAKDNGQGFGSVTVTSAPVKLKVVQKKE
jgi:hypothetical protein